MAANAIVVYATPQAVFDVLSEPAAYADWVVGSSEIIDADGDWPAPGSRFVHLQGLRPFRIRDSTSVLECDAPRRLVLEARVRPFGVNRVAIDLYPAGAGTRVVLHEHATAGPATRIPSRVYDALLSGRNTVALRRLKRLAEGRPR
jgi:uncharacterized protein YndB with AHSA1/START domain